MTSAALRTSIDTRSNFTIRFSRVNAETEYSKIMAGFGDRLLYMHVPDGEVVDWFMVDLHAFRRAVRQHSITAFAVIKTNKDQEHRWRRLICKNSPH